MVPAASGVISAVTPPFAPYRTSITETTLSLAMNPLIREVTILQSPRPSGLKSGAITPAITARMLVCESSTMCRPKSKWLRNQTTIVAMRITENALCRKSLDFSHRSRATFLGLGMR